MRVLNLALVALLTCPALALESGPGSGRRPREDAPQQERTDRGHHVLVGGALGLTYWGNLRNYGASSPEADAGRLEAWHTTGLIYGSWIELSPLQFDRLLLSVSAHVYRFAHYNDARFRRQDDGIEGVPSSGLGGSRETRWSIQLLTAGGGVLLEWQLWHTPWGRLDIGGELLVGGGAGYYQAEIELSGGGDLDGARDEALGGWATVGIQHAVAVQVGDASWFVRDLAWIVGMRMEAQVHWVRFDGLEPFGDDLEGPLGLFLVSFYTGF